MLTKSFVTAEVIDFSLHKLRKIEGEIVDEHLLPFVTKELTDRVIIRASEEFFPSNLPESMSMELLYNNFFIPWLLFNWIPSDDFGIKNFDPNKTIAQNYIALYNQKLSSIQRQFIELMDQTFYSFYSIQEVEYEKGLVIKDILLKTVHIIKERSATHTLNRGDIIFSHILTLNNQSIFIGMAPYVIPARYHNDIINRAYAVESTTYYI